MQHETNTFSDQTLWIAAQDKLPDRCCICGMFTDKRVTAVHTEVTKRTVSDADAGTLIALGCLLHLLGPIGWILAWFLSGGSKSGTKTKNVARKHKLKISQCQLCAAQEKPQPIGVQARPLRMQFVVHPQFHRAFEEVNTAVEN